jgi:tetratricopeptide (TPR) repeat protein
LRSAAEILQTGAAQLAHHAYFATLIEAMIAIGDLDDATRTLDFVFRGNPQPWILPELLRMRAMSERAAGRDEAAESTLTEALRMADRIGCLGWKLRTAHDLALLMRDRGHPTRARQILGPAYGHFSDGFDTGDLVRSRELLEQLT